MKKRAVVIGVVGTFMLIGCASNIPVQENQTNEQTKEEI